MADRARGPDAAVAARSDRVELRRCALQGEPVSVRGALDAAAECERGAAALAGDAVVEVDCARLVISGAVDEVASTMQERGVAESVPFSATPADERRGGKTWKCGPSGDRAGAHPLGEVNVAQTVRCAVAPHRLVLVRRGCAQVLGVCGYRPQCGVALAQPAEREPA